MIIYYWLIGILPLVQHPLWTKQIGPLTMVECVGIICLFYAVGHSIVKIRIPPILSSWELRLFILLYCIAVLSALFQGHGIDLANGPFIIYTSSLLLVLMTVSIVDSLSRLRWATLVFIGSYAFASLYVLREWQKLLQ